MTGDDDLVLDDASAGYSSVMIFVLIVVVGFLLYYYTDIVWLVVCCIASSSLAVPARICTHHWFIQQVLRVCAVDALVHVLHGRRGVLLFSLEFSFFEAYLL